MTQAYLEASAFTKSSCDMIGSANLKRREDSLFAKNFKSTNSSRQTSVDTDEDRISFYQSGTKVNVMDFFDPFNAASAEEQLTSHIQPENMTVEGNIEENEAKDLQRRHIPWSESKCTHSNDTPDFASVPTSEYAIVTPVGTILPTNDHASDLQMQGNCDISKGDNADTCNASKHVFISGKEFEYEDDDPQNLFDGENVNDYMETHLDDGREIVENGHKGRESKDYCINDKIGMEQLCSDIVVMKQQMEFQSEQIKHLTSAIQEISGKFDSLQDLLCDRRLAGVVRNAPKNATGNDVQCRSRSKGNEKCRGQIVHPPQPRGFQKPDMRNSPQVNRTRLHPEEDKRREAILAEEKRKRDEKLEQDRKRLIEEQRRKEEEKRKVEEERLRAEEEARRRAVLEAKRKNIMSCLISSEAKSSLFGEESPSRKANLFED